VLTSDLPLNAEASRNQNVRVGISTGGRAANRWCRIATLSVTRLWTTVSTRCTEACSDMLHPTSSRPSPAAMLLGGQSSSRGVGRKTGIWEIPDEAVYRTRG
jgi:hypothetical protein